MNKNEEIRLQKKRKRLRRILIAEAVVAVLAIAAAAAFTLLPLNDRPDGETKTQAVSADTGTASEKESITASAAETADTKDTEAPEKDTSESTAGTEDTAKTEEPEKTDDSTETQAPESTSGEETQAPESSSEETTGTEGPDYSRIVFVGDSRTKTMSSGGRYEFRLVPDDSVCATWGGQLTDEAAFTDAAAAAAKQREKAVFWFGINDVQLNPERDNPEVFIRNYDRMLAEFRTVNDYSTIYLLSILPTSIYERDYYEGQDENIRAYNEALKIYAAEHGYVYLDLSPLYTGEECFAEGDQIHFSESWYRERFIPAVTAAVGISGS